MITPEELTQMEKRAKEQQSKFLAQNPDVQVPPEYGTDTLRLIALIRQIQSIYALLQGGS
jgi:hypothetical protein